MSKRQPPIRLKTLARKAMQFYSPKPFNPKREVKPKPKVANVTIIKTVNLPGELNYSQLTNTLIEVTDPPTGETSFELVVVMSPADNQPPQYPPFQKHFVTSSTNGSLTILIGGPLSFASGLEPPTGTDEYILNLVQDVNSGDVWDIEDAQVNVIEIQPKEKEEKFTSQDVKAAAKPKPKVANVTIIKTVNLPGDVEVSQAFTVRIEAQDLPAGVSSFSLNVVMTALGTQPDQVSPTTATFTLQDGKLYGHLNYDGEPDVSNNAYALDSVTDTSTGKSWEILNSSVPVIEES